MTERGTKRETEREKWRNRRLDVLHQLNWSTEMLTDVPMDVNGATISTAGSLKGIVAVGTNGTVTPCVQMHTHTNTLHKYTCACPTEKWVILK